MGPGLYISNKFPSMSDEYQSLRTIFLENKVQLLSHTIQRPPVAPACSLFLSSSALTWKWLSFRNCPCPFPWLKPSSTQHKEMSRKCWPNFYQQGTQLLTHLCILDTCSCLHFSLKFLSVLPIICLLILFILSLNTVSSVTTPCSCCVTYYIFLYLFVYTFPSLKGKLHEDLRLSHSFLLLFLFVILQVKFMDYFSFIFYWGNTDL